MRAKTVRHLIVLIRIQAENSMISDMGRQNWWLDGRRSSKVIKSSCIKMRNANRDGQSSHWKSRQENGVRESH